MAIMHDSLYNQNTLQYPHENMNIEHVYLTQASRKGQKRDATYMLLILFHSHKEYELHQAVIGYAESSEETRQQVAGLHDEVHVQHVQTCICYKLSKVYTLGVFQCEPQAHWLIRWL